MRYLKQLGTRRSGREIGSFADSAAWASVVRPFQAPEDYLQAPLSYARRVVSNGVWPELSDDPETRDVVGFRHGDIAASPASPPAPSSRAPRDTHRRGEERRMHLHIVRVVAPRPQDAASGQGDPARDASQGSSRSGTTRAVASPTGRLRTREPARPALRACGSPMRMWRTRADAPGSRPRGGHVP